MEIMNSRRLSSAVAAADDTSDCTCRSRISRSSWSLLCTVSTSLPEWLSHSSAIRSESVAHGACVEWCCSQYLDWILSIALTPNILIWISVEYLEDSNLCSLTDWDKYFRKRGGSSCDRCSIGSCFAGDNVVTSFADECFSMASDDSRKLDDCCSWDRWESGIRFAVGIV